MGKPTICLGENKGADQLRGNREADQCLCFRYSDSTVPLLLKSKISSVWLFSVTVQVALCRTWSETTLLVFPRGGSYLMMWPEAPKIELPSWDFKLFFTIRQVSQMELPFSWVLTSAMGSLKHLALAKPLYNTIVAVPDNFRVS